MPSDKKKDDDNGMSTSGEIRRQDQYGEQGKSSGQKEREAAQKERESERERDSGVEEDRDGQAWSAMQAGEPQSGIPLYAEYAKEEVAAQDLRKTSFEQRAITVITTSGALVTLLFGLAALSTKEAQTFVLPQGARDSLGKALVLFVSAAALALLTNLPLKYEAVKPDDIKNRLEEGTPRDQDAAAKDIALTRIKVLKDAKTKNTIKGLLVLAALLIEVVAVGFVADGVHQVITG